jgi:hypothetical protein
VILRLLLAVVVSAGFSTFCHGEQTNARTAELTPPATPLIACDPYFSVWSAGPELAQVNTSHWTGKPHRLISLVRIDGKTYRLMGTEPRETPVLAQKSLEVRPTETEYTFAGEGIELVLAFTTPSLPEDIDLLSRPITYVTYTVRSVDGKPHEVQAYFDASGELAVNMPHEEVKWADESTGDIAALKIGSTGQDVLGHQGDDIRINWGYLYVAAPEGEVAYRAIGRPRGKEGVHTRFCQGTGEGADVLQEKKAMGSEIVGALALKPVNATAEPVSRWLVVAYDDLYSIEYMQKRLRPYWRRNGMEAADLLREACRDYQKLIKRCKDFDQELLADLTAAGGEEYAALAALAYRQCLAAGKFVADDNGQPIQFCKENHSNGCIATSDVFYPMSPQFLLFGPSLAKSFVVPFMNYAASPRWKFPFAPHDLGQYPKANGQVYGGGEVSEESQMPVEESGNLLILMAAIAQMEGNADFAGQYWPQLTQWAEYLEEKGFDPENQLCTDDFAGHLAHNVNLSAKAICGLGSYAKLCEMRGDGESAEKYKEVAKRFAQQWIEAADDGDHFRLTFDGKGTWSQKYNLVWDKVLGLDLFPDEVRRKEMDYYLKVQNEYGLPLDSRDVYTKLDWILWSATLTGDDEDFRSLVSPVVRFLNHSPDHVPMTDWYRTHDASRVWFTARPVVGGVFMRMLYDDAVWRKWASRDATSAKDYAGLPSPPRLNVLVPAADTEPVSWRYAFERPGENWHTCAFDDSDWEVGKAGFGTPGVPNAEVGVVWQTPMIWIRREFAMPETTARPHLYLHHDEDVQIFLNGVLAAEWAGFDVSYSVVNIRDEALATLKPTGNVMAIVCRQTRGGQYIDAGLVTLADDEASVAGGSGPRY